MKVVERARAIVEAMERADAAALRTFLPPRHWEWLDGYLGEPGGWGGVGDLVGSPRSIVAARELSPTMARLALEGPSGPGFVTVRFDGEGLVQGFALYGEEVNGIGTVVIACPPSRRGELDEFYARLLGRDRRRVPSLGFGEGRQYLPPRWPDAGAPAQMHLDIRVPDFGQANGAKVLADFDDHCVYEDPVGHPFCLYRGGGGPVGFLWRIVVDCPSPRALAPYYEGLLGFQRVDDAIDRVVVGAPDGRLPLLAFQHVPGYVAPRWPDPAFPIQMHFDLKFDDRKGAEARALALGAIRMPPGGSCPIYADPAGHPSCFCYPGE